MLNLCLLCEMIIGDGDMSGSVISKHKKCGLEWDDVELGEWGLDFFPHSECMVNLSGMS